MASRYHAADSLVWIISAPVSMLSVPCTAFACPNGFFGRLMETTPDFYLKDQIYLLGLIFATSFNIMLINRAMSRGGFCNLTVMRKLGSLNKALIDILSLAVAIALRYSFGGICNSIIWSLMVIEFQIICKMLYDSPDLLFTDVIVGVIMQIIVVSKKEDLYHLITMIILCLLIIYHRHWSTPSSTTIFETEEISQVHELDAQKTATTTTTTSYSAEKPLEDV